MYSSICVISWVITRSYERIYSAHCIYIENISMYMRLNIFKKKKNTELINIKKTLRQCTYVCVFWLIGTFFLFVSILRLPDRFCLQAVVARETSHAAKISLAEDLERSSSMTATSPTRRIYAYSKLDNAAHHAVSPLIGHVFSPFLFSLIQIIT